MNEKTKRGQTPRGQTPSVLLLLLFFLCCYAFADESKISVKAEVNKAFITIGDPILYTIIIQHDPKIRILSDIQPPAQDILKLKKLEAIQKKEGPRIYEGKKFTLTAFSLGDFVLDPVTIEYQDTDGQKKTLQTDKIYITVKSVAEGEQKTDIRGIKSVIKIPAKFLPYIYSVGALLAILIIVVFWRRRKKAGLQAEPELIRSIEDEALFQLNKLFDSDWLRRGKIKEYYLQLSEILRVYFERRYKIPAIEATTYEIHRALKEKELEPPLRELINEVLEAADLAKFAKWKPEPPQIIQLNQKAKQIIEMARPREIHTPAEAKEISRGI